jgi:acetyl-CoA acetyltransferase
VPKDVFIIGGARTPMTEYTGALKDVSALELGAIASRAAFERTGVRPEWIDHAVFGNVLQTSSDAIYGARHVALKAGVPQEVPALTVNRLCGSGIQAAVSGAQLIQLDEAEIVLTGGIENMSQAPHVIRGLRSGLRLNQGKLEDYLYEALLPTAACSWRRRPRSARRNTTFRATSRTNTRCAASRRRRRRGPRDDSRTRSCPSSSRAAGA